jgi:hypothetical protein
MQKERGVVIISSANDPLPLIFALVLSRTKKVRFSSTVNNKVSIIFNNYEINPHPPLLFGLPLRKILVNQNLWSTIEIL